jgi:hypothetical protein
MLYRNGALVLFVVLAICAPHSRSRAQSGACLARAAALDASLDGYPEDAPAPTDSLKQFESVFLGEVVVPSRPCSLGTCAGLKVVRLLKGELPSTVLVNTLRPGENPCGPRTFNQKGERWMVFADHGTSRSGVTYVRAEDDGPTFASRVVPDFEALDQRYRQMRARLDHAIEARLPATSF